MLMTLDKNDVRVFAHVCALVSLCEYASTCLPAQAGSGEYTICVHSGEYHMHLTSSRGRSLLVGINHDYLWQASPAEVIHGAADMTFHSGTQLSPLAWCAHSFL